MSRINNPTLDNISGVGNSTIAELGGLNEDTQKFIEILENGGIDVQDSMNILRLYNSISPKVFFREGIDEPLFVVNMGDSKILYAIYIIYI